MMMRFLPFAGVVLAIGCSPQRETSTSPAPVEPHPQAVELAKGLELPLNLDDPAQCAVCHSAVAAEWRESMHARAHQDNDPLFAAMRDFRLSKGQLIEGKCERCHSPRSTESPIAQTGVSCATCHNLEAVHLDRKGHGIMLLEFAQDDTMRSARDVENGRSPVHGNGAAHPALADGKTVCLACHRDHTNPAGVPVCTTGSELEASSSDASCTSCHMPEVAGASGLVSDRATHRSHAFLGPHRAYLQDDRDFLASAVKLSVSRTEPGARVTMRNESAHGFPSGFPGRTVVLRLEGKDNQGRVRWRNFESAPMEESPQSVLNKVYVDEEGAPTLPPMAKALGRDNRLAPDETRTLDFVLPKEITTVEASLHYSLIPASAAKRLGFTDPILTKSVEVARATSAPSL